MCIRDSCNGDAAGDQFIHAYRKALENSKNPKKDKLRPVMIHCQTAREDQLEEMKELGILPSIFVGHVYYWGEVHRKNLGEERAARISPCHSAFSRNMKVTFHQDTPVTKPVSYTHLHWLKKYDGKYAASPCSCRLSRQTYDEGCADDPEDWCIAVGDMADYVVETQKGGRYITCLLYTS